MVQPEPDAVTQTIPIMRFDRWHSRHACICNFLQQSIGGGLNLRGGFSSHIIKYELCFSEYSTLCRKNTTLDGIATADIRL